MSLLALIAAHAAGGPVDPPPDPEPYPDLPDQIPGGERLAPYAYPTSAPWNVPNVAITPTPDGTGSTVHPGVIDMVAETGQPFRGWRYWMVVSPYAGSNDQLENPCILVSNHGWEWQPPAGLTNPIDGPPSSRWYADPDIAWDHEGQRFVVLWNWNQNGTMAATSADGVNWTLHGKILNNPWVSPALVRRASGDWHLWIGSDYEAGAGGGPRHYSATGPLGPWLPAPAGGDPLGGTPFTVPDPGTASDWHHDVVWDEDTGHFFWLGNHRNDSPSWGLYPAVSTDGINWTGGPEFMTQVGGGFMYRATMTRATDPDWYNLWYSYQGASDLGSNWWTKHTRIPRSLWTDLIP